MIARSEEEFQLFQRMDGKRITRESIDEALRHSSRLMYEDDWWSCLMIARTSRAKGVELNIKWMRDYVREKMAESAEQSFGRTR